jgi:NAD(P)-dependent dehydrogenase (short-subunit alcohol dehydrogenase family)
MTLFNAFRYDGKRVLVVGGATGMGAAVAELVQDAGAEVVVMDFAAVTLAGAKAIHVNLADKASIDTAIDECGSPVHALFSCAGVADGTPGLEKINFIGHRYMIDVLRDRGILGRGAAIGFISSAAGLGWEANLPLLKEYLDVTDFDGATGWAQEHLKTDYMWSKQAICAYVAREAMPLLKAGIRINAICPGPTDTPLAQANKDMWLGFGSDYRAEVGIEAATPLEQAYPLVFLCSDAAVGITGTTMITDAGYFAAGMTEAFPDATPAVNFLLGRY